jgi:hypothetical protein
MRSKIIRALFILAVIIGSEARANGRVTIKDGVSGAPVPGATVILAEEGRIGPYPVATSDAAGQCDIPSGSFTVLVVHPFFLPKAASVTADSSVILLQTGAPVADPKHVRRSPSTSLRIYLLSWIGHFDVEQLPPLPLAGELRCGRNDVVFDLSSSGHARALGQGAIPELNSAGAVKVTAHVSSSTPVQRGVVYLVLDKVRSVAKEVPRTRFLDSNANASFDDVTAGERLALVAAPEGFAPTVKRLHAAAANRTIEITPGPSLEASAHLRCERPIERMEVHATLTIGDLPQLAIDRRASLAKEGEIRVGDLGSGVLKLVVAVPERRDLVRKLIVSPGRTPADFGALCPDPPFSIQGSVVDENDRLLNGVRISYADAAVTTDAHGRFTLTATHPDAGPLAATFPGYLRWQRWFEPLGARTALVIRLTKGVRYALRVIDRRTGDAIPKFTLRCYSEGEGPKLVFNRTVASDDGRYLTPPLADDVGEILVSTADFEQRRQEVKARRVTRQGIRYCDIGTVDLTAMSRMNGRVVDDLTNPVKEATIRIRSSKLPDWDSGAEGFNVFEARSGADGKFVAPVAAGIYTVQVVQTGFAPAERTSVSVEQSLDLGDIELHSGQSARIHMTTPSGAPAVAVTAELHRGTADDKTSVVTAMTNDEGNATFSHLSPGGYTVVALRARRLAQKTFFIDSADSDDVVQLQVGDTTVRGFAMERGQPKADAVLTLMPSESVVSPALTIVRQQVDASGRTETQEIIGRGAAAIVSETDSTGFFSFTDVQSGKYLLSIRDGSGSRSRSIIVPDVDVFDASTDFGGVPVAGIVTDSQSSAALPGSTVVMEAESGVPIETTTADEAGRFEIANDHAGAASLRVSHDGYQTKSVPLAEADPFVAVALQKARLTFRGSVIHHGALVGAAMVAWQADKDGASRGGTTSTDADGRFVIDGLSPGALTLAVSASGLGIEFTRLSLTGDEGNEREIEIHDRASLLLTVPPTCLPQQVRFRFLDADVTELLWRLPTGAPVNTGGDEWTWSSLGPGTYRIFAAAQSKDVTLAEGDVKRLSFIHQ